MISNNNIMDIMDFSFEENLINEDNTELNSDFHIRENLFELDKNYIWKAIGKTFLATKSSWDKMSLGIEEKKILKFLKQK